MSWMGRRSQSVMEAAVTAAVCQVGDSVAAVGIWVVWMRSGRVLACEWASRLDVEVPVECRGDADEVVVIAVAPTPVAHPVSGRVDVLCEYLADKGFRVHAVYVPALREGAVWTSLRGRMLAAVVHASRPGPRIWARRRRLPRQSVVRVAACALVAAMVLAAPIAVGAPPARQPGLSTEPQSPGQAGVTASPRSATPAADNQRSDTSVAVIPEQIIEPSWTIPARPSWSAAGSAQWVADPGVAVGEDTLRFGAAVLPRPDWMPVSIAARERDWNAFLADRAGAAADQVGLTDPAVDTALGVTDDEQAPPQELVLAQMVATDPQMLVPAVTEALEPLISEVAAAAVPEITTPAADLLGVVLTPQPPA